VESYYQETGRAGRDGLKSEALLFYFHGDVGKMKRFVEIQGNADQTVINQKKVEQMGAYGEIRSCRRKYLLHYFDEAAPEQCGNCDVCLSAEKRIDMTEAGQKVLSAVSRLQERFGAIYIIDFLLGSNNSRIQESHKSMKTFGVGKGIRRETWSSIIKELLDQGYLTKSGGFYQLLQLTFRSDGLLRGDDKLMVISRPNMEAQEGQEDYELPLLRELKDLRRHLAASENVPPYIVLSDASLIELATYLPSDPADFAKITGFGEVKVKKYSVPFGDVIKQYCHQSGLETKIHLLEPKVIKVEKPERDTETKQQSLSLLRKGHSLERIGQLRQMATSTIAGHLAYYIKNGKLDVHELVDSSRTEVIREAIRSTPGNALTPVRTLLGDSYSFEEITLVKAAIEHARNKVGEVLSHY
jgi:ATP-dependent DNA helicase RecQ